MLEFSNLTVYASGTLIVDDVSFTVEPGRVVGFVGPNGAGKTTTLRALLGLQRVQSGTALVEGSPYAALSNPTKVVGSSIDSSWLDPRISAEEQLIYAAKASGESRDRVKEVLQEAGLWHASDRRVKNLSLGMKQRLGICIALLNKPSIYVFDEPINGLDPDGILWFRRLVSQLRSHGCAVLLSSHVMSELQAIVDDVVVLRSGRVLTFAPISDLEGRASTRVRVEGDGLDNLQQSLQQHFPEHDLALDRTDSTTLHVFSLSPQDVFRVAAGSDVSLWHLSNETVSLEDHYQRLVNRR